MRHHLDLADQGRTRPADDGTPIRDLASALAMAVFCAAISFILLVAILPELPA